MKTRHVLITIFALLLTAASAAAYTPQFLKKWGTQGSNPGQFLGPYGVACDATGNVYVVDNANSRVQVFTNNGGFLFTWGSLGSGPGQFSSPYGIAIDTSGDVYVADANNHRIQKFDASGAYLTEWGTQGNSAGQLESAQGVAIGPTGNVYVADTFNHRVQVFDNTGAFLNGWGSNGSGNGEFSFPRGIATDDTYVYVVDTDNFRVQLFKLDGTFDTIFAGGSFGTGNGEFLYPYGIAVGTAPAGYDVAYVCDWQNYRVQTFARPFGIYDCQWGTQGNGDGQFAGQTWVAVDPMGNIFVADGTNHRVQKFGVGTTAVTTSSWGTIKSLYR